MQTKRLTRIVAASLWLLLMLCLQPATLAEEDLVGYTVIPMLTGNQNPETSAYFDLRMQPGQSETLRVEIDNTSAEGMRVSVEAVVPYTADNGVIEYTPVADAPVSSTLPSFAALASVSEAQVQIPAGESRIAEVSFILPDEPFDGEMFGAIRITKLLPDETDRGIEDAGGVMIRNQYTYAIPVLVKVSDVALQPNFTLEGVSMQKVHYQDAIVHALRNTQPILVNPMTVKLTVYQGERAIESVENTNVKIAPDSSFSYVIYPSAPLGEGEYRSVVALEYQGQTWSFEKTFTVSEETQ